MPEGGLGPLPEAFLRQLDDQREILVTSRDPGGEGSVRMWFAAAPSGHVYLLTPAVSRKAQRWLDDPWVRLRVVGAGRGGVHQEGVVELVASAGAWADRDLLVDRFRLAGAATPEALDWMLDSGSHLLLRVGLPRPGLTLAGLAPPPA
ncbi:MAG TPA: hypothetical protein VMV23_11605 [Candidatus Nanopelagicaceae bacterium]|nr:hypothetical protein [Candidatus Nanopelagicaceae bacterium]